MSIVSELVSARKASHVTQTKLAQAAGLSRMTVQRVEAGDIDPRISTVLEMGRVVGMELMLVPAALRTEVEAFLRSSGRMLGQPAGAGAPPSVVQDLGGNAS